MTSQLQYKDAKKNVSQIFPEAWNSIYGSFYRFIKSHHKSNRSFRLSSAPSIQFKQKVQAEKNTKQNLNFMLNASFLLEFTDLT